MCRTLKISMINRQKEALPVRNQSSEPVLHSPVHKKLLPKFKTTVDNLKFNYQLLFQNAFPSDFKAFMYSFNFSFHPSSAASATYLSILFQGFGLSLLFSMYSRAVLIAF